MGEINGPDPADGASGALGKEGVPSHGGLVASFDDDAHSAGEIIGLVYASGRPRNRPMLKSKVGTSCESSA
jgi:hypothetical protein